jgi:hypothetical protein
MSSGILISGEIYSIKINKYLSVHFHGAAFWAKTWLHASQERGGGAGECKLESHLLCHPGQLGR